MTKTLTEQWRNGTLKTSRYYVKFADGGIDDKILSSSISLYEREHIKEVLAPVPRYNEFVSLKKLEFVADAIISGEKMDWENIVKRGNRKEMAKWINERKNKTVDRLQKQLEIATKALKEYANEENWRTATTIINTDYFEYEHSMYNLKDSGFEEAQKALKEMEGVK